MHKHRLKLNRAKDNDGHDREVKVFDCDSCDSRFLIAQSGYERLFTDSWWAFNGHTAILGTRRF